MFVIVFFVFPLFLFYGYCGFWCFCLLLLLNVVLCLMYVFFFSKKEEDILSQRWWSLAAECCGCGLWGVSVVCRILYIVKQ